MGHYLIRLIEVGRLTHNGQHYSLCWNPGVYEKVRVSWAQPSFLSVTVIQSDRHLCCGFLAGMDCTLELLSCLYQGISFLPQQQEK